MAIESARAYFRQHGLEDRILTFDCSSATVALAAQAVGCEPARIAKTLSFRVGEDCILLVCAGDAKVDNTKFKAFFHEKAKMLTPEEVLAETGHAVGGVCPFAVENPHVKTYLDCSLQRFQTVFPACGNAASAIKLTIDELFIHAHAVAFADVCKAWQSETEE